jgi:hypothetical protein
MRAIARDSFARSTLVREIIQPLAGNQCCGFLRRRRDLSTPPQPILYRFGTEPDAIHPRVAWHRGASAPGLATTRITPKEGAHMHRRTVHAHLCLRKRPPADSTPRVAARISRSHASSPPSWPTTSMTRAPWVVRAARIDLGGRSYDGAT